MSTGKRIALIVGGIYLFLIVLTIGIFGWSRLDNEEFKPQNEFKLDAWVDLGPFDINKAVLYLFIATVADDRHDAVDLASGCRQRPNRVQTAVEWLYTAMRDNITGGNMDDKMARKWFPFIGTLFLFIWFSNLIGYIPLPTNTEREGRRLRRRDPLLRALRRDREPLDPARARARRVHRLQRRGHPGQGRRRLSEEPDPRGDHAASRSSRSSRSSCSRTSCA